MAMDFASEIRYHLMNPIITYSLPPLCRYIMLKAKEWGMTMYGGCSSAGQRRIQRCVGCLVLAFMLPLMFMSSVMVMVLWTRSNNGM